jgi:hypothetical protein
MTIIQRLEEVRRDIPLRMAELQPAVDEYARLEETMNILDRWQKDRDRLKAKIASLETAKPTTRQRVEAFILDQEAGVTFRPRDMIRELELSQFTINRWLSTMVEENKLEKFGRGLYRRPLVKTGEAKLRVVTK